MPFWSQVIDFFFICCINDTDLQKITKTEVVGLQKSEMADFSLILFFFYDIFERTQCLQYVWPYTGVRPILTITCIEGK